MLGPALLAVGDGGRRARPPELAEEEPAGEPRAHDADEQDDEQHEGPVRAGRVDGCFDHAL